MQMLLPSVGLFCPHEPCAGEPLRPRDVLDVRVHTGAGEGPAQTRSLYCHLCSTLFGYGQRTYTASFFLAHRAALSHDVAPMGDADVVRCGRVRLHFIEGGLLHVAQHHFVDAVLAREWFAHACVCRASTTGQHEVREWLANPGARLAGCPDFVGAVGHVDWDDIIWTAIVFVTALYFQERRGRRGDVWVCLERSADRSRVR